MVQDIVDQRLGRHEELGHRVVGVRFAAPSMTECKMSSKVLTIDKMYHSIHATKRSSVSA